MYMMTVYTKSGCPACLRLKQVLDQIKVAYKEVNLDDSTARSEFILSHPHVKMMPFYEGHSMTFR